MHGAVFSRAAMSDFLIAQIKVLRCLHRESFVTTSSCRRNVGGVPLPLGPLQQWLPSTAQAAAPTDMCSPRKYTVVVTFFDVYDDM